MTRSELVAKIAKSFPNLTSAQIEIIVHRIFEQISQALAQGDRVELRGFGAFSVRQRGARQGRNPRTGEHVMVDQKNVPFFKAGKDMRQAINDKG